MNAKCASTSVLPTASAETGDQEASSFFLTGCYRRVATGSEGLDEPVAQGTKAEGDRGTLAAGDYDRQTSNPDEAKG